ncbi:iron ABC transporter permease [Clostridium septicum]|uniref:FecCD family ABC transporter permease n=1 Tax=Clostridium septicum TaxID=1504 RepID=UPI00272EAEC9|nr:iron ABC transporter permease [Clostridium septicum]WLF70116.1 iron ABC transporter permease [Clostridium septicum]
MKKKSKSIIKVTSVILLLSCILCVLALISMSIGSARYSLSELINNLLSEENNPVKIIIYNLRLPRIISAILIGAALSVSGALLQAVMRNPLADPGTIGVSAGAGAAATTILLIFPHMTTAVPVFSFGGAALACGLIYLLAWRGGIDPVRIILSGVAINSVLGGYNGFLQMMYSDNLQGVLGFLNGSLAGSSWNNVRTLLIYVTIGLLLAIVCIKSANALQLGDEMAKNLGINVNVSRIVLSAISAFLAASTVSAVGMIGFVGLVVPHIARIIVGSDYKIMVPTSMLLGAVILLLADTVGRSIVPGMDIPVGTIMSMIGGPFFLYMLRKKGKVSGN